MKKVILAALVLALTSGAAMADRFHGGGGGGVRQGGVAVHSNASFHGGGYVGGGGYRATGGWHGGTTTVVRGGGYVGGGYGYRGGGEPRYYHTRGIARANIWVDRPVIRDHYYRYGYRPGLIVENYGPREGYIFVRGNWQWNGYEWIWQPGHYEPDMAYVETY